MSATGDEDPAPGGPEGPAGAAGAQAEAARAGDQGHRDSEPRGGDAAPGAGAAGVAGARGGSGEAALEGGGAEEDSDIGPRHGLAWLPQLRAPDGQGQGQGPAAQEPEEAEEAAAPEPEEAEEAIAPEGTTKYPDENANEEAQGAESEGEREKFNKKQEPEKDLNPAGQTQKVQLGGMERK
ncbi:collagen alpha-1(I) chain-like [Balaenoptera musculus]|uniref:Collagen alpha-1(I) chain-like n=1 Tax=Balaenoptera musculus TaxID=9771 RepID=A0A8B8WDJ0_BALMU|nr:collagen alpha-1(I) chain-like [Balaenoptera musculus]